MREKYGVHREYGDTIVPEFYQKQIALTKRLHTETLEDDELAERRRRQWELNTKSPIVVRFHADWGCLPSDVALELERDLALYAIRNRLCVPVHEPAQAIIESDLEGVLTPPELAEVVAA